MINKRYQNNDNNDDSWVAIVIVLIIIALSSASSKPQSPNYSEIKEWASRKYSLIITDSSKGEGYDNNKSEHWRKY